MSADVFKATAALVLFSIAVVGGLLPQRFKDVGSRVVSCLNTAAGGVFFASAMVHMLPESSETLADSWGDDFPWGGFICSVGFLLILCIDQAVSISNTRRKGGAGHTLLPTMEPASDVDHDTRRPMGRSAYGRSDSADIADLEMSKGSAQDLLHSSAMGSGSEQGLDNGNADSSGTTNQRRQLNSGNKGSNDDEMNGGARGRGRRAPSDDLDGHDEQHTYVNGGGHGHGGHSHGLGSASDGVWVRLALLIALSVHSVMEGLGVGAKSTKAYNLLFAIGAHKGLAAYALGASLLQSGVTARELAAYVIAFAAMTPCGIVLGALIEKDGEDDTAGAVCVALASGTFLYISLMEVLPRELASTEHGWSKMASLLAGFCVSAGVGWLVG